MPDQIFANPRLAEIYDHFEGARPDLEHYSALLNELGATSVLDIGCGTGSFAVLLAEKGLEVIGVDPASASLEVARNKPGADRVKWILGDATDLPPLSVDVAIMTGNVGQVFVSDESWTATLSGLAKAVRLDGHLVFEVRDPVRKAWLDWTKEKTNRRIDISGVGPVTSWVEVTEVSMPYVTFEWNYHFEADDTMLTSTSTLRFRDRAEINDSLDHAGFATEQVRDAPDRPGKEWVFVSRRLS